MAVTVSTTPCSPCDYFSYCEEWWIGSFECIGSQDDLLHYILLLCSSAAICHQLLTRTWRSHPPSSTPMNPEEQYLQAKSSGCCQDNR